MSAPFVLAFPPSLNNAFINVKGRGRVPSKRYQQWRYGAAWDMRAQKVQRVSGPVLIRLEYGAPDKRKRDLDNLCKPVLDALVAYGAIEDDHNGIVRGLHLSWVTGFTGVRITISTDTEDNWQPIGEAANAVVESVATSMKKDAAE